MLQGYLRGFKFQSEAVSSRETSLCCPLVVFKQRKSAIQPQEIQLESPSSWPECTLYIDIDISMDGIQAHLKA